MDAGNGIFVVGGKMGKLSGEPVRGGYFFAALAIVVSFTIGAKANAQNSERLLSRDVMAFSKAMPKDVRIYHYFRLAQLWDEYKTPDGRASALNRYLSDVTARFWDLNYHATAFINAGPGLYLAIDPYISSDNNIFQPENRFGNTMIELVIPRGTRVINVVKPVPIAKDTLDALVNEGIIARHQASFLFYKSTGPTGLGFYRDTLKHMTDPGFEKFRTIVLNILRQNSIEFIEYNWDTRLHGFCSPKTASAFNYVGTSPWNIRYAGAPMMSSYVFPDMTAGEQELNSRIIKFRDLLGQMDTLKKRGVKIPSSMISNVYTPQEYKALKDMTYSCD